MNYPTLLQVEAAHYEQLKEWTRNLPEPGTRHVAEHPVSGDFFSPSRLAFANAHEAERLILGRICDRAMEMEAKLRK